MYTGRKAEVEVGLTNKVVLSLCQRCITQGTMYTYNNNNIFSLMKRLQTHCAVHVHVMQLTEDINLNY